MAEDRAITNGSGREITINAHSVSRGTATGRIVCLYGGTRQFYRISLSPSRIPLELRRLGRAFTAATRQLDQLIAGGRRRTAAGSAIFDVHRMILADGSFRQKIEDRITSDRVNAEWAVKVVIDEYVTRYKSITDEHLRSRYIDIEDIGDRILAALGSGTRHQRRFAENSIIVAKELKPSTLYELDEYRPAAIITETGGWTSHTFILARELGIPAVTGAKKILRHVRSGDSAIVDGFSGTVILRPESKTLDRFVSTAAESAIVLPVPEPADGRFKMLDGREIRILVNTEHDAIYRRAERSGATGVGLYRSESLFNRYRGFPNEKDQLEAYRRMVSAANGEQVNIRLFDVSADLLLDQNKNVEKNPALGLRGVRLGLTRTGVLRPQLRAMLRASDGDQIGIIIPLVSDVGEIRSVRRFLEKETAALRKKGVVCGSPRIGAMIETPAAVFMIDEILDEVDFISLGTNDLVQYTLAVDRDNENVSSWFKTLHPAILRSVRTVLAAANERKKPAIVCGEMAGSPYYVPILLGLGAENLSINPASIGPVTRVIAGIAFQEAAGLVNGLGRMSSVDDTENTVFEHIKNNWSHLYSRRLEKN